MITRENGGRCTEEDYKQDPGPRQALIVRQGQEVRLRLIRNLSSAHTREDEIIHFEVLKDVVVEHRLIVARRALASGTVTEANPKRSMGRAGTVQVTIDSARPSEWGQNCTPRH